MYNYEYVLVNAVLEPKLEKRVVYHNGDLFGVFHQGQAQ
jgi:hypothetical protein